MASIQKMPAARQIQPIGFPGRLEAIRAPTMGKARKGSMKTSTALSPPVPQVLGGCTDRVATYRATDAAQRTSERPASNQASQEAIRPLIGLAPPVLDLSQAQTVASARHELAVESRVPPPPGRRSASRGPPRLSAWLRRQ